MEVDPMPEDKSELLNALSIDRTGFPRPGSTPWAVIAGGVSVATLALAVGGWFVLQGHPQSIRVAAARPVASTDPSMPGAALLDASGYVVARREATVGPKIAGKLRDVLIEEGMRVEAGQVIAHLDDSNALAAMSQARAMAVQAETTEADARPVFQRASAEVTGGLLSRDAFETAKQNYDQTQTAAAVAHAALAVARQNEDDTVVRAPFSGVVTVKAAQAGEIISPLSAGAGFTRTGIATIVDMDSIEVDVDVSENVINRVSADQPCTVTLNAYPDARIPCHVIAVVPTADRTKATVSVRVGFDAKDPRILPEMGARVSFLAGARTGQAPAPTGVTVPSDAVTMTGDQAAVFVVRDGRAERRSVKLGSRTAEGQVVVAGLSSGETVAVSAVDKLKDGANVSVDSNAEGKGR
jgi:RND family efflux transporter MFP subunit